MPALIVLARFCTYCKKLTKHNFDPKDTIVPYRCAVCGEVYWGTDSEES